MFSIVGSLSTVRETEGTPFSPAAILFIESRTFPIALFEPSPSPSYLTLEILASALLLVSRRAFSVSLVLPVLAQFSALGLFVGVLIDARAFRSFCAHTLIKQGLLGLQKEIHSVYLLLTALPKRLRTSMAAWTDASISGTAEVQIRDLSRCSFSQSNEGEKRTKQMRAKRTEGPKKAKRRTEQNRTSPLTFKEEHHHNPHPSTYLATSNHVPNK